MLEYTGATNAGIIDIAHMYLFLFNKRTRLEKLVLSSRILSRVEKNLLQTTSTNTTYRTGFSEYVFFFFVRKFCPHQRNGRHQCGALAGYW